MRGAFHNRATMRGNIALMLVALALMMRALVPAGWMPASGKGVAITLCTGMGAVSAWVDEGGIVHKGKPLSGTPADHPCAFAGIGIAADLPSALPAMALAPLPAAILPALRATAIGVGRGLAAPPPPPTGPPASL
ncbi:hypothetical protein [Sphingobium aquiterrae]|uniref:hypothetical protein n=1 Tax=Sphingobium aquiterrae TaxID=2038656 RepID=UPI00301ABF20